MEDFMRKNKVANLLVFLLSELIYLGITSINLIEYDRQKIYLVAISIVQLFYFIPILLVSCYFFLSQKAEKKLLTHTTFFLIFYSIILHFFIKQLAILFTNSSGILNFVEYSEKIYFICLPLLAFEIFSIKKETLKNLYFLLVFKIIGLFFITFVFKFLFGLKGVLYGLPLCEFLCILIFFIKSKICRLT